MLKMDKPRTNAWGCRAMTPGILPYARSQQHAPKPGILGLMVESIDLAIAMAQKVDTYEHYAHARAHARC